MLNCDGLVCIADSLIDCVRIILCERLPEISKARFHLTHLLCKGLKGNPRLRCNGQGNQYLNHNPNQIRSDPEDVCWPRKISVFHGTPASSVVGHCAREDSGRQVPRNARPSPERIDRQIVKWLYFSVSIRAATR